MFKRIFKSVSSSQGFSMLESAMTTIVLSTALLASMSIMQNVTGGAIETDLRTIASQIASDKIEEILADRTFRGYTYLSTSNYPTEVLDSTYEGYTQDVQFEEVCSTDLESASEGSGLMKVTVTVSWGDEEGQAVTLSTVLSDISSQS